MDQATQEILRRVVQGGLLLRAKAHMWHLQTSSYAQHMAFEELYTAIGDGIDKLAEVSIGSGLEVLTGPLQERWQVQFTESSEYAEDLLPFFTLLVDAEKQTRTAGLGWVANLIEEVHGDLRQPYYKLKQFS